MANKLGATSFRSAMKVAGIVALCLVSGVIGGSFTRHFGTSSYTLSYADFISVMLTAVSLLMTVLAIFLAVLGFLGWTTIEQKVDGKAEGFLVNELKEGGRLHGIILDVIEANSLAMMFRGVQPVGEDDLSGGVEDNSENGGAA